MSAERDLYLVDRHTVGRDRLREQLLALVERYLRSLSNDDFYGDAAPLVAESLAASVRAAQQATADLTWAYLDAALQESGERPSPGRMRLADHPRGVDPARVWDRPLKAYRLAIASGETAEYALAQAVERAVSIAEDDLTLAVRQAAAQHSVKTPWVTGQRRVIHPELSAGGTCGLCIAASDRIYRPGKLLPVHDRCKCTVAEVTKSVDPGNSLNNLSLGDLYEAAGSTAAADLKATRWKVTEHGELGPVLSPRGADVRTPAEVAKDTGTRMDPREMARRQAVAVERAIARLEERAARGEDVAMALKHERRLLERLRKRAA
ncbi:hypothetical protein [Janibacter terrae]|uniref:hypothetical protein n=1 Tax=Janibacter terrae TaxID=103817 RepID=UPI0031F88157